MEASAALQWLLEQNCEGLLEAAAESLLGFRTSEGGRRRALAQIRALLRLLGERLTLVCFESAFNTLALARHKYAEDLQLAREAEDCAAELGSGLRLDDRLAVVGKAFEARRVSDLALFSLLARLLQTPAAIADGSKVLSAVLGLVGRAGTEAVAEAAVRAVLQLLRQSGLCPNSALAVDVLQAGMALKQHAKELCLVSLMQLFADRSGADVEAVLACAAESCLNALVAEGCGSVQPQAFFGFLLREVLPAVPALAATRLRDVLALAASIAARDNDPRARFEAIAAVHALLVPALRPALAAHTPAFLRHLIAEGLQWRAGKPATQVRQAAVLCLAEATSLQLLDGTELAAALPTLLPVLKGCLNDDWAPELRLQSCLLLQQLVEAGVEAEEFVREACPALLERLDDAQDAVRICAADALAALLRCAGQRLTPAASEQTLKTLFIHLDDGNPSLQEAVFSCIVEVSRAQPERVGELATRALSAARSPTYPQRLLSLLQDSSVQQ